MGLLDQIIGKLGGQEPVERLAREEADFDDPQSPDFAHWNELVGAAPPEAVQDAMAHAARNSFNRCVLLGNGGRRDLPVNLVPPGAIATGFGPITKLAGELYTRVLTLTNPISANSLVVAGGIEDEVTFLPLIVERLERQVLALRRLAAIEGILAAQAMDISGDRPGNVPAIIYHLVRQHADTYWQDRPLSAEVEAVELALGSDELVRELISHSTIMELDEFFALGPVA